MVYMSKKAEINSERCKEVVWHQMGAWGNHSQCEKRPKKDGYCTIHHPDYVKAKKDKREEKYQAECKQNSDRRERGKQLCKRLGIEGGCSYGIGGYSGAIEMSFEEAEKLIARLQALDV